MEPPTTLSNAHWTSTLDDVAVLHTVNFYGPGLPPNDATVAAVVVDYLKQCSSGVTLAVHLRLLEYANARAFLDSDDSMPRKSKKLYAPFTGLEVGKTVHCRVLNTEMHGDAGPVVIVAREGATAVKTHSQIRLDRAMRFARMLLAASTDQNHYHHLQRTVAWPLYHTNADGNALSALAAACTVVPNAGTEVEQEHLSARDFVSSLGECDHTAAALQSSLDSMLAKESKKRRKARFSPTMQPEQTTPVTDATNPDFRNEISDILQNAVEQAERGSLPFETVKDVTTMEITNLKNVCNMDVSDTLRAIVHTFLHIAAHRYPRSGAKVPIVQELRRLIRPWRSLLQRFMLKGTVSSSLGKIYQGEIELLHSLLEHATQTEGLPAHGLYKEHFAATVFNVFYDENGLDLLSEEAILHWHFAVEKELDDADVTSAALLTQGGGRLWDLAA